MELWGGAAETRTAVEMTGLEGVVVSKPFDGAKNGGDVYYFTSCASGRISRILLADVAGHGLAVAETADLLRSIMRRHVNVIGQSSLMTAINKEFSNVANDGRFATAIVATYFEPQRSLTVSIAGHPPPLVFRKSTGVWEVFGTEEDQDKTGLPLGIVEIASYEPQTIDFQIGDQLLLFTDAYFEALDESGTPIHTSGLLELLNASPGTEPGDCVDWLTEKLRELSPRNLQDDDATAVVLQPTGTGIPMKNNLLAPFRMIRGVTEESVEVSA
jgi:serine phosphatase RsbU (regulator of sigma subunit)